MKTFLSKQKNKIASVIMLVAVLTTIFILPIYAYDPIYNEISINDTNTYGQIFSLKDDNKALFLYAYNHLNRYPYDTGIVDNKEIWYSFEAYKFNGYNQDGSYNIESKGMFLGIRVTWDLNTDYNRPQIDLNYLYRIFLNNVPVVMQINVKSIVYVNDNTFVTLENKIIDYGVIQIYQDITDPDLQVLLTSLYYNRTQVESENNDLINNINNNNAQQSYNQYHAQQSIIINEYNLNGVSALIHCMATPVQIGNLGENQLSLNKGFQFIIYTGIGILAFVLLARITVTIVRDNK